MLSGSSTVMRVLSVIEVIVSANLIFQALFGELTVQTILVFAVITLLFSMTAARGAKARREEQARKNKGPKLSYDKEKFYRMKEEALDRDESEYETTAINPNYYANKILNGEMTIDDVPDTKSKIAKAYEEEMDRISQINDIVEKYKKDGETESTLQEQKYEDIDQEN